ncbi:tetratricopeptide repeat-containing sensor histidine kinase [Hymenobacter saemangeumensis]
MHDFIYFRRYFFWGISALLMLAGFRGSTAAPMPPPDSLAFYLARPALPDTMRVKYLILASFYQQSNDLAQARQYSEQALALARRIGFKPGTASALETLGNAHYYAGNYPQAQRLFLEALALNKRLHRQRGVGNSYLGLGNVAVMLYDRPKALQFFARAQQAFAAMSPPSANSQILTLNNIAGVYLEAKNPAKATQFYRRALALTSPDTEPRLTVAIRRGLAEQQLAAGNPDSAQTHLNQGLALAQKIGEQWEEAGLRALQSRLALRRGHPTGALAQARQALHLARQAGHAAEEEDALRAMAAALAALGRSEAYDTLKSYLTLHDTLLARDRADAIIAGQARFNDAEQQARIRSLEQQERLARQAKELAHLRYNQKLWALSALAALALAAGGSLLWLYRRRQRAREQSLRRQIAADLHDDVGSLLTQISLQSELLSQGVYGPEQQERYLAHMAEASRMAVRQMSDVVWGLSQPGHSPTLGNLLERMREHAFEVLEPTHLGINFQTAPELKTLALPASNQQTLFLIYKEALHNATKHAKGATEVLVRLQQLGQSLQLEVRDNGQPGASDASHPGTGGNGLGNMQARAANLGGRVAYEAAPGGFCVVANLPLG